MAITWDFVETKNGGWSAKTDAKRMAPPATTLPLRLLLVEDSEDDALLLTRELRTHGWEPTVQRVETADAMRRALAQGGWDLVVCDWSMPEFHALAALALVRECSLDLPFIILSGSIGEEAAANAMRSGAHDVVLKNRTARLMPVIQRELAEAQTRRQLRASEELLTRSGKLSAIGQMVGGVSHDLINLLNPVGLQVHALEDLIHDATPRRILAQMKETVALGLAMVERLRDFSRGWERAPSLVDLDRLVHDAVQLARPRAAALHKPVRIHEHLGHPPSVFAHADEVVAAVVNLVLNAIDAVPRGGSVTVTTEPDGVQGASIEVADDGPGIAAEVECRIFEPFFTTKGAEGTGLGLTMVFETMRRHGGSVELQTELGRGTRFRLRFPTRPPAPSRGASATNRP
jgi:signal transduction histidine kinase